MKDLNSHIKLSDFIINDFIKVHDIIYFDGPILTHFKDKNENNYLFLWIDNDETSNRWLISKNSELEIFKYLKSKTNLKDLYQKDFLFIVDIDATGNLLASYMVQPSNIVDYLPQEDYFTYSIPASYNILEEKYAPDFYLDTMKNRAIYIKMKSEKKYSYASTVRLQDIKYLIEKVQKSYEQYIIATFRMSFEQLYKTPEALAEAVSRIISQLELRVVDLNYKSFGVGISTDTIIGNQDTTIEIVDWKKDVLSNYKKDVIEIDYSSEEDTKRIAQKFTEEERNSIYKPIQDAISTKKLDITVSNSEYKEIKKINKINKKTQNNILPKLEKQPAQLEDKGKKLVSFVAELPKDGDITKIKIKELHDGLLFSEDINKASMKLHNIEHENLFFELKQPIEVEFSLEQNNLYKIDFPLLQLSFNSSKENLKNDFQEQFFKKYNYLNNTSEELLNPDDIQTKGILSMLINEVRQTR